MDAGSRVNVSIGISTNTRIQLPDCSKDISTWGSNHGSHHRLSAGSRSMLSRESTKPEPGAYESCFPYANKDILKHCAFCMVDRTTINLLPTAYVHVRTCSLHYSHYCRDNHLCSMVEPNAKEVWRLSVDVELIWLRKHENNNMHECKVLYCIL